MRRRWSHSACLVVGLLVAVVLSGTASAQSNAWSSLSRFDRFTSGGNFSPGGWMPPAGSNSFLPIGGMGGFVPYTSGPGLGLGVMSREGAGRGVPSLSNSSVGMGGMATGLGQIRSSIAPPAPIRIGSPGGMGGGRMSGVTPRGSTPGGSMNGMARPPVGTYPFRIPPSLFGPAPAGPAMSM